MFQAKFTKKLMVAGITLAASLAAAPSFAEGSFITIGTGGVTGVYLDDPLIPDEDIEIRWKFGEL